MPPFVRGVTSPNLRPQHKLQSYRFGIVTAAYWQPDNALLIHPTAYADTVVACHATRVDELANPARAVGDSAS